MLKPCNIYLIRHAQSLGNVDKTTYSKIPDWKIPLTEHGKTQAQLAALQLNNHQDLGVYVSPYLRTIQTWDIIKSAVNPIFVKQDPRLREQELGNFRHYGDDVEKERQDFGEFYYRFSGGESGSDVWARSKSFINDMERDCWNNKIDSVLLVTHGFTMRALLMNLLDANVDEFHTWENPRNAQIISVHRDSFGNVKLGENMVEK